MEAHSAAAHVLSWAFADAKAACRPSTIDLARSTFQRFATTDVNDARVAVKVATALGLPLADLGGSDAVAEFAFKLARSAKDDAKALRPMVGMLRAYPELLDAMGTQGPSCAGLLAEVVHNGQAEAAISVARSLDRKRQVRICGAVFCVHPLVGTRCLQQVHECSR